MLETEVLVIFALSLALVILTFFTGFVLFLLVRTYSIVLNVVPLPVQELILENLPALSEQAEGFVDAGVARTKTEVDDMIWELVKKQLTDVVQDAKEEIALLRATIEDLQTGSQE